MSSTLDSAGQRGAPEARKAGSRLNRLSADAACGNAEITGIQLAFCPWEDNGFPSLGHHGLVPNHGLLDAFAREYANNPHLTNTGAMRDSDPEMQDFFLLWLHNRLFNIVSGAESPPAPYQLDLSTPEGMGTAQWLAHLIGYYAAVWLRACWIEFEGPRNADVPMRDRWFSVLYKRNFDKAREVALNGSDAEAIAFSRGLLRKNTPQMARPQRITTLVRADRLIKKLNDRLPGDVGIFGFNAGFLRHILPPSLNAPTDATPFSEPYYTGDPNILFDAHFALPEVPFLTQARETYVATRAIGGAVASRLDEAINGRPGEIGLLARQQNWDTLAAALYRVGVPGATVYRGFDQAQYDRLLAWTSYSVMHNVAGGYNALSAYATQNAHLARQHITASTLWWTAILTYVVGCVDGRDDGLALSDTLARFITAERTTCQ